MRLLLFLKALADGERWITVHPHGPGSDGQAVLIKPVGDGAFKVIGGAGGGLNHLKLRGVKPAGDYKESVAANAQARREAKLRQRQRDREAGLTDSKARAKEVLRAEMDKHNADFVQTVADAMGWDPADLRFPEEKFANLSEAAIKVAARKHARALVARAKAAVAVQRERLLHDAEARSEAGIGEVPLTSAAPETLSVNDLDPIAPATKGLGFTPDYKGRAEARGASSDQVAAEADAARPVPADGGPTPAERARERARDIAEELASVRDPAPKLDAEKIVDAKRAVELLKAEKALRAVRKQARQRQAEIDAADQPVEPKAYILESGGPVDKDVTAELENDLRTIKTRAFLDAAGGLGDADSLGKHVGAGAFNAINSVSLAAAGTSMVDRSVVDVLGIAGAAQVVARRLAADLTPEEVQQTHAAMQRFHVEHYMEQQEESLRAARDWQEMAHEIEVGEAATGAELAVAQEMNAKRREFTENARQILGTALGEMEANAALVVALGRGPANKVEVSMGRASLESAITQARAIGLDRGDYEVARIGANTILTVHGSGLDKLAQPVSRDDLHRTREAMDIIDGGQDEDGWLPDGVARRPDLAMNIKPGTAPRLAAPFDRSRGVEQGVRDFIGSRAADGDAPADIMAAALSEDTLRAAGDRQAFMAELERIAPLYGPDGKMVRAEAHEEAFRQLADDYVQRRYGGKLAPIHRQDFPVDATAVDALHRAFAEVPEAPAAFKPVGEMTPQEQGAIRSVFVREHGRADPAVAGLQERLEKLERAEPEREVEDMFGRGVNPAWRDWQAERNGAAEALNKATMTWSKYVDAMGSPARAYSAMQDVLKGRAIEAFAAHYARLRPDAPLKVGTAVIRHDLAHLDALDPAARDARLERNRKLADSLRNRAAGRYAAGSVTEKMEAARAAEEARAQSQMGLFGTDEAPPAKGGGEPEPLRPVEMGERRTLGIAAERTLAGMAPIVGAQFRAGQKVSIWQPDMSGLYAGRQRAVKLARLNKRMALGLGVGSGKTSIGLTSFTHMHAHGDVRRGIFAVPSIVQGEFHGTALTLLEPGKYRWHADPGASREERIAAYKDPSVHFSVVTHQAFRDDMMHLAAKRESITPAAVAEKLDKMTPDQRADYMRELMAAEGIDHDFLAVDEGHNLLNRAGKENSNLANVFDAVSDNMRGYLNMTADPVKNDASEAFDLLSKMDRKRYSDRAAFLRKYGVDTPTARDGLQRELARHYYTGKIDPGVQVNRQEVKVDLSREEEAHIDELNAAALRAKIAQRAGRVDVDAMRALSPSSFEGIPEAQHEAVARTLQPHAGIMHETALRQAVSGPSKVDALAREAVARRGKQGVVFARHLGSVEKIAARLKAEGMRVVTLTGADSAKEKDAKKRAFQGGEHDVIVLSDAGAVGANLQAGKWLAQFDTPDTAMVHAQRNGRIHRMGQRDDIDLMDIVARHPSEARARKRLADKYDLRDVMTSPLDGLDDRGFAGVLKRIKAGEADAAQPHVMPAEPEEIASVEEATQGSMF